MASTPVVEMPEIPVSEFVAQNDGTAMNAPSVPVAQQASAPPASVADQEVVPQQRNALTGKQEHCKYSLTKTSKSTLLSTCQTSSASSSRSK